MLENMTQEQQQAFAELYTKVRVPVLRAKFAAAGIQVMNEQEDADLIALADQARAYAEQFGYHEKTAGSRFGHLLGRDDGDAEQFVTAKTAAAELLQESPELLESALQCLHMAESGGAE